MAKKKGKKEEEIVEASETEEELSEEESLQRDLLELAKEKADMEDKMLRAMAEMQNLRNRTEKTIEDARKYAVTDFANDLVDALDNLYLALENISQDEVENNPALQSIVEGIEMSIEQFLKVLKRHGVERINPIGERFDHNLHEAVVEIPDDENEAGTIVQVMKAGYKIKERLLRPAIVGVAKAAATKNA